MKKQLLCPHFHKIQVVLYDRIKINGGNMKLGFSFEFEVDKSVLIVILKISMYTVLFGLQVFLT